MHDLAEHTGALLSIIGSLVAVAGFLIWNKLNTIEKKVDQNAEMHFKCREELPVKFVGKGEFKEHRHDFKEWQDGRTEIWQAINSHSHDANRKVVR